MLYPANRLSHITVDHPERVPWVQSNAELIRKTIEQPEIVYSELVFHKRNGRYTQVCIAQTPGSTDRYAVAVLHLARPGIDDHHELWTVHECKRQFLFRNVNGAWVLKPKYKRVVP